MNRIHSAPAAAPTAGAELLQTIPVVEASVITMGIFDGLHRGHQALIQRAVDVARARGLPAIGLSFSPHPARVLAPDAAPKTLISEAERAERMLACGLDRVVIQPFTPAFSQLSAERFEREALKARLHAAHIVVGFNFCYGQGRAGDGARLAEVGPALGFTAEVLQAVTGSQAAVVSSTRIRAAVAAGELAQAAALLGRPYELRGEVVRGAQRGRQLGFPTANLQPEAELLPKVGVYAVWAWLPGEPEPRLGVTNIGHRPSFDGGAVSVETHLPGFSGDLYGQRLRLRPIALLRGERRFDGVEALKAQVAEDIAAAQRLPEASP